MYQLYLVWCINTPGAPWEFSESWLAIITTVTPSPALVLFYDMLRRNQAKVLQAKTYRIGAAVLTPLVQNPLQHRCFAPMGVQSARFLHGSGNRSSQPLVVRTAGHDTDWLWAGNGRFRLGIMAQEDSDGYRDVTGIDRFLMRTFLMS